LVLQLFTDGDFRAQMPPGAPELGRQLEAFRLNLFRVVVHGESAVFMSAVKLALTDDLNLALEDWSKLESRVTMPKNAESEALAHSFAKNFRGIAMNLDLLARAASYYFHLCCPKIIAQFKMQLGIKSVHYYGSHAPPAPPAKSYMGVID